MIPLLAAAIILAAGDVVTADTVNTTTACSSGGPALIQKQLAFTEKDHGIATRRKFVEADHDKDEVNLGLIEIMRYPWCYSAENKERCLTLASKLGLLAHRISELPRESCQTLSSQLGLLMQRISQLPRESYDYIAKHVPYHGFYEEVMTFPERQPFALNVVLATTKSWLADLLIQLTTTGKGGKEASDFDWRRSLAFATFGCLYLGMVQWFLCVFVLTHAYPQAASFANEPWSMKLTDHKGQFDLVLQVLTDMLVMCPFIYFPTFYTLKEMITQGISNGIRSNLRAAFEKYRKNIWYDIRCNWCLWVPADFLIYSVPMYVRMPLDHCVSFIWTMFLSYLRGDGGDRT